MGLVWVPVWWWLLVEVGVPEASISTSEVGFPAEFEKADETGNYQSKEAQHLFKRRQPQNERQEEQELQFEQLQDDQHGDKELLKAEARCKRRRDSSISH